MLDKDAESHATPSRRLRDGMTLGIGGWGPRRKPMALVREILRSPLRDLTLVRYGGPGRRHALRRRQDRARSSTASSRSTSMPVEPWFRKAREAGAIEAREIDEGLLQWGCKAAGMRAAVPADARRSRDRRADDEPRVSHGSLALRRRRDCCWRCRRSSSTRRSCTSTEPTALGNAQTLGPDPYFDDAVRARRGALLRELRASCVERMDLAHPRGRATEPVRALASSPASCTRRAARTRRRTRPRYGWDMITSRRYSAAAGEDDGWARVPREVRRRRPRTTYLERSAARARIDATPGAGVLSDSAMPNAHDYSLAELLHRRRRRGLARQRRGARVGHRASSRGSARSLAKLTDHPRAADDRCRGIPRRGAGTRSAPRGDYRPKSSRGTWRFARVFDCVWGGRRHVMIGPIQIDRCGPDQPVAASATRARPKVQMLGVRGLPGQQHQSRELACSCRATASACSSRAKSTSSAASATTRAAGPTVRDASTSTCASS